MSEPDRPPPSAAGHVDGAASSGSRPNSAPEDTSDLRVLLIESNVVDAEVIRNLLAGARGADVELTHVESLAAARETIRTRDFDAVVSDIASDTRGWQALRELTAADDGIPLVVMIRDADDAAVKEMADRRTQDYFIKGASDGSLILKTIQYAIERKQADRRLAYVSHYDKLTGLANRELFRDRLEQAMLRADRSNKMVALLFLDLDRFKSINDSMGHLVGDELLIKVANRLKTCVRRVDTIARLGGDEFTVIIEDAENEGDASRVCDKMLAALTEPIYVGDREIYVTTSIGVTFYPRDAADVTGLLRNADTAMYRAKEDGRNKFETFTTDMNTALEERVQLEAALRHAVEEDELFLCYQPKLSLQTGQVIGVEALLRWTHREFGNINPQKFIPVAEDTGLIVPIGEWVLERVCRDLRRWHALGYDELSVAINLSARQFRQGNFSPSVERIIDDTAVDPNQVVFEITESVLMEDSEVSRIQLDALKAMGVMVYLDDFGTGYSSLSYLKRFRIDGLKINQGFIRNVPGDVDEEEITRAVIALGRALHLGVIAEGVENQAQLDFLLREGCDAVQGFLFSKPLLFDDLTDWLAQDFGASAALSIAAR